MINESSKYDKKNMIMIAIIVTVILVFVVIIYMIKSNSQDNNKTNETSSQTMQKAIDFNIVDDEADLVQTRFLNKAEEDIRVSNDKTKEAITTVDKLEKRIDELDKILKEKKLGVSKEPVPAIPQKDFSDLFSQFPNGLPKSPASGNDPQNQQQQFQNQQFQNSNIPKKPKEEIKYEYEEYKESMTVALKSGDNMEKGDKTGEKGSSVPANAFFVPAGSVAVAYLEQGYDAPTLKSGKSDLVPSTLTIVGYTLLPNNKLYDLRGCKILAEAEGKRSNERAYSRTKRLSCINNKNSVMDIPLSGYISDEGGDGKLGLKGNIVSMQNKFLQNAIWVSVVEGVASMGKAMSMTQTPTIAGGVVNTVNPGDEFTAGVSGGVGETASTIKDFMMDNVKSIEPVVEIKGGRLVAITLTEGFYVYPRIEYTKKDI